jgi:acyl dehydratase
MAIDYEKLLSRKFTDVVESYSAKDTMLYALGVGVGLGEAVLSDQELSYIYEENLIALPTMAVVLGHPGFWLKEPDVGIDWLKVLHVEHSIEMHRPLAASGTIRSKCYISEIVDLGEKKGALITWIRELTDELNGNPICCITQTGLARGDGGFGGPVRSSMQLKRVTAAQERSADIVVDLMTSSQSALIYRLSGDYNPLHAVPAAAAKAGFDRPILHGLCTFAIAGRALLMSVCDYEVARLKSMSVRFSSPVFPGETIRTELWMESDGFVRFQCWSVERDLLVLKDGLARVG